jgi:hypothetical protein
MSLGSLPDLRDIEGELRKTRNRVDAFVNKCTESAVDARETLGRDLSTKNGELKYMCRSGGAKF